MMQHLSFQPLFLAILFAFFLLPQVSWSQEKPVYVQANLVAEETAAVPGEILWVGLHQEIQEKWHTYWRNPGDSGLETTITWQNLPQGIEAGEIKWPIPKAIPFQILVNYGYEDSVLLAVPFTIPKDFSEKEINLEAKVTWLVCHDVCIPEADTLLLTIPVSNESKPSEHAALFEKARQNWPQNSDIEFNFSTHNDIFELTASKIDNAVEAVRTAHFFPYEWGIIPFNAEQNVQIQENILTLRTTLDGDNINDTVSGVLVIEDQTGKEKGFEVLATIQNSTPSTLLSSSSSALNTPNEEPEKLFNLSHLLVFALLGGMILNLMPCVFPVLSLKALSLVSYAEKSPGKVRISGLVYTLGVLLSFGTIGAIILGLRVAGDQVGWGFQLQSPLFVSVMALFLYLIGLNLIGFFNIGSSLMGMGNSLSQKSGYHGSFWTGVLATIVATPCTAPFMASALGATLVLPYGESFLIFLALGFGMALPYLFLTIFPSLFKLFPKPGPWMDTFKQLLAFPMIAFAIWLTWVLSKQSGADSVIVVLTLALFITFLIWLEKKAPQSSLTKILFPLIIIGSLYALVYVDSTMTVKHELSQHESIVTGDSLYIHYSAEKLEELRANKQPVFVNMTAAWCITCLANERIALSSKDVQAVFKTKGITVMKGDWTSFDQSITDYLNQYNRTGVPLYVYYDEKGEETILPQLLTPSTVIEVLKN